MAGRNDDMQKGVHSGGGDKSGAHGEGGKKTGVHG